MLGDWCQWFYYAGPTYSHPHRPWSPLIPWVIIYLLHLRAVDSHLLIHYSSWSKNNNENILLFWCRSRLLINLSSIWDGTMLVMRESKTFYSTNSWPMRSLRHERLISEVLKTLGMVTSLNLAILYRQGQPWGFVSPVFKDTYRCRVCVWAFIGGECAYVVNVCVVLCNKKIRVPF